MTDPKDMRCVTCRSNTPTLSEEVIAKNLQTVNGWEREGEVIKKTFSFRNFMDALAFCNKVGEVAEEEEHHPDIHLYNYKMVTLTFTTHSTHGLTNNDFVMAAKVDAIT